MHLSTIIFLLNFLIVDTAKFKSLKLPNPFEIIIGFLVFATFSSNGMSIISGDAILYAGQLNCSRKSTVPKSKTDANSVILFFLAYENIFLYQLLGV